MPNKRAPNKLYLGGFVDRKLKEKISELACQASMQHQEFGFALQLIQEPLNRRRRALRPVSTD
jgi:hypothetical protein